MQRIGLFALITTLLLGIATVALGAGGIEGAVEKQSLNISAIVMFFLFVSGTLGITYWAAQR
ncbi:MAG: cation acetate symporter, partial [Thiotrichaceae bacterium]